MGASFKFGKGKIYIEGEYLGDCEAFRVEKDKNNNETIKPNHSKLKTIYVDIETKGYESAKQQLRNLEARLDRILEKQEKIGAIGANTKDNGLLQRIDNDCGRIVRMLQGKSTNDMDKIAERYGDRIKPIRYDGAMAMCYGKAVEVEAELGRTYTGYGADKLQFKTLYMNREISETEALINIIIDGNVGTKVFINDKEYRCGGGRIQEYCNR